MSVGKLVVVVALVGGAVFLAAHLSSPPSDQDGAGAGPAGFQPPSRPRRDKIPFTKSSECRECHPDVYAEWHGSHHRMAYTNPEVQKLSTGFQGSGVDCLPCHLPRPMFQEGFGLRPLERLDRRAEGVDCFTCHYYEKLGGYPALPVPNVTPYDELAPASGPPWTTDKRSDDESASDVRRVDSLVDGPNAWRNQGSIPVILPKVVFFTQ